MISAPPIYNEFDLENCIFLSVLLISTIKIDENNCEFST